jgi:glycosyltransferase involved in cell wall biosynthesis
MALLRQRDRATLPRVHRFVANSTAVRNRIRAFWRRDADVIFPPVDVERFTPAPPEALEDYYFMVSRLVPYKRFDLAIEAFNALGLPLVIAGAGRDRARLEALAGPTIRFLGRVSDARRSELYARCRAAVFMSEDDFGIAQVEAQAAGRPVIAFAAGGVFDTVVPERTGVYVAEQTVESLIAAVRRFERLCFVPDCLVTHARSFSRERFERELAALVRETLEARRSGERMTWN